MSKKDTAPVREHDFTLILTGITELNQAAMDPLFEAGCDDALIGMKGGRAYAAFTREAPTLKDAILSAIRDIQRAGIGAGVLRIDSNTLVTQAEIAKRIGRTRQLVNQYNTGMRGPGGFPAPVGGYDSDSLLWDWCEVARWLRDHDMIEVEVAEDAQAIATINAALELQHQRQAAPETAVEVERLVGAR
jgi:hypothetical protein